MKISGKLRIPASLCMKCRGGKLLCGLSYCPISVRLMTSGLVKNKAPGNRIQGSSPPSVFVGRYGYPKVTIYPSSPPYTGDTSRIERSSEWLGMGMEEFLSMRLSLFRGGSPIVASQAADPGRLLQEIQLMEDVSREEDDDPILIPVAIEGPYSDEDIRTFIEGGDL